MSSPRLLVFAQLFIGTKSSRLWARIYEEYQSLSKKFKIIVITDKISTNENKNISLVKTNKISVLSKHLLCRVLSVSYAAIKQRKSYDLVFIRVLDYSMFAGIISKKLLKIKLIVMISNTDPGFTGIKRMLHKFLFKKTLECANVIVTTSAHLIDDVENYIGSIDKSKIALVKWGINTSRFRPLNINRNKNEILYVGRINKIKGIEDILQALPKVIDSIPDVKLKIIGDIDENSYYEYLTDLISKLNCEKNIDFMGPISYNQLITHYNSASIFVLTSKSEAVSQVTHEAMACGLPVIVTSVGILAELIKDGENGFLVKHNQPNMIAEKIILLLQNKSLRTKIGKAARQTVIDNGNFDSYIDQLSKLFSNESTR